MSQRERAAGPRGLELLRLARALKNDPIQALTDLCERYGDFVELRVAGRRLLVVHEPGAVSTVLQDRDGCWIRSREESRVFGTFLGRGLLTSNGEAWREQRREVQPPFVPSRLGVFVPRIQEAVAEFLSEWRTRGGPVDLGREAVELTFAITLDALVGARPSRADTRSWLEELEALSLEHRRLMKPLRLPRWIPTPSGFRFRRSLRAVRARFEAHMTRTEQRPASLLDALSPLGSPRDPEQVRDQLLTVLYAGYATAATTLCWLWPLLEANPAVEEALRAELAQLGGQQPDDTDLPRLALLGRVVDETLRLYPPVWILGRQAARDTELSGRAVPAGTQVLFSPWVLHRHPDHWDDPEAFRPERFTRAPPRGLYLPFGDGPRVCPGAAFALLEIQIAAAMMMQACRTRLVPGQQLAAGPGGAVRPRSLLVTLESVGAAAGAGT